MFLWMRRVVVLTLSLNYPALQYPQRASLRSFYKLTIGRHDAHKKGN